MKITQRVKKILSFYDSENPGIKTNLCRILMNGCLAGTGRIIVLTSEDGIEQGPAHSFSGKSQGYDPHYHFQLAKDAEVSAYAAPLGMLEAGSGSYAGSTPLILKINTTTSLNSDKLGPTQAITASVKDALRLGCCGVGFTIYPGSDRSHEMFEDFKEIADEAKTCGLSVTVWSSPKGGFISKDGETAIDACVYSAHIAAVLGAHIINVALPSKNLEQPSAKRVYKEENIEVTALVDRIRHVMQSAFNGRRIVTFNNKNLTDTGTLVEEAKAIRDGGGFGSFFGKNLFQRSRNETIDLIERLTTVYTGNKKENEEIII